MVETELAAGVAAAEEPGTMHGIVEEVGANWALHDFLLLVWTAFVEVLLENRQVHRL